MRSSRYSRALALPAVLAAGAAYLASSAWAQSYQQHNLTPDGYWHNRYHMILSMAVYGDYNTLCPNQTFTEANMLKNYPDSTRAPWDVVSTFGPTPSGGQGFTSIVPEMNKALIIFQGNYALEQTIPTDVIYWNQTFYGNGTDTVLPGASDQCHTCTVNAFAFQGYLEARNATNNWQAIKEAYYGQDLVFSITGHGLGGMHSQIAAMDLYQQNIDYYNHAYGSPRVFNGAGSEWYADRFDGEAGERGVANNDVYSEFIPQGDNYTHAGTPFYYYGYNNTALGMNWEICWAEDSGDYPDCVATESCDYSACMPQDQGLGTTAEQDHYFYFTPVQDCGLQYKVNPTSQQAFLAAQNGTSGFSTTAVVTTSTSSSSIASSTPAAAATTSAPPPAGTTAAASGASTVASLSLASLLGLAVVAIFPSLL